MADWLIDYVDGCETMWTVATNEPIAHPQVDIWAWENRGEMMPLEENSSLVHQSSLTILPAESSGNTWEEWTKGVRILPCKLFISHK
jgi:hypothetical protein